MKQQMERALILDALETRVTDHIPLTRHIGFRFADWQDASLRVTAPIEPNRNDKQTFFAGSQSVLFTLSGWALTTLVSETVVAVADVVAVESHLDYLKPVHTDATVHVQADEQAVHSFKQALQARHRGRLAIDATLYDEQGQPCSTFKATYYARKV